MAILIEEEKKNGTGGILTILTWLIVLGAILGAAYYLFFAQPQLVGKITAPAGFQNTQQLIQINLNPQAILQSQSFQALKQYITPLQPSTTGRPNPFLANF